MHVKPISHPASPVRWVVYVTRDDYPDQALTYASGVCRTRDDAVREARLASLTARSYGYDPVPYVGDEAV